MTTSSSSISSGESRFQVHEAVASWVAEVLRRRAELPSAHPTGNRVLEVGSLDINGGVRHLFDDLTSGGGLYVGIDAQSGPGVDLVADASVYKSPWPIDIVVCLEVFEHTSLWPKIIRNMHETLAPGGVFIATMAGEGRRPHSAIDEKPIRPWEYYQNVTGPMLESRLRDFSSYEVNVLGSDTRCWAVK